MALTIIDANVVLDVYDHDAHTSSTKLKAIALDCNTRFISAAIRKSGDYYDVGPDTEISLTIIRPDGNGVKIVGESTPIHITEPDDSSFRRAGHHDRAAFAVRHRLRIR